VIKEDKEELTQPKLDESATASIITSQQTEIDFLKQSLTTLMSRMDNIENTNKQVNTEIVKLLEKKLEQNQLEKVEKPVVNREESREIHHGVTCDACNMYPIIGSRFKCMVRSDFDLCENCEKTCNKEGFPMLKLTKFCRKTFLLNQM